STCLRNLLCHAERLQRFNAVPAAEFEKGLLRLARAGERLEEPLHRRGQIYKPDCGNQLAANALVTVRASADLDLIALFAVDLHAHQANVSDVVLRARVRAPGNMQVDRLKNLEALI